MNATEALKLYSPDMLSKSPRGVRNAFVPLTEKWAIKISKYQGTRDTNYENQKRAAEHGLGPDVGEKIDIDENSFGYITEIVEVLDPMNNCLHKDYWYEGGREKSHELMKKHGEALRKLIDDLDAYCDFNFEDIHSGNLGWKNGKLICIDFDSWD